MESAPPDLFTQPIHQESHQESGPILARYAACSVLVTVTRQIARGTHAPKAGLPSHII